MKAKFLPLPRLTLVRTRFNYDKLTGIFTYNFSCGSAKIGSEAGNLDTHGYVRIRIEGKLHYAHRLAYFYVTGEDPLEFQIDHEDLNRENNKWNNLRKVSQPENMWNTVKPSTNTSGIKGVNWNKTNKAWYGEIKIKGVRYRTKGCPTKEVAEYEIKELRENLHKEFTNHG